MRYEELFLGGFFVFLYLRLKIAQASPKIYYCKSFNSALYWKKKHKLRVVSVAIGIKRSKKKDKNKYQAKYGYKEETCVNRNKIFQ